MVECNTSADIRKDLSGIDLSSRRHFIQNSLLASASLLFPSYSNPHPEPTKNLVSDQLADQFLTKSIDFLRAARHPNGFYYDMVSADPKKLHPDRSVSVAGTGFGLAASIIACSYGLMDEREGYENALQTLLFAKSISRPEYYGWLPHFANPNNGAPEVRDKYSGQVITISEISSIDTALFIYGALAAGEYFKGNVKILAEELFHNINFNYLLTDKLQFEHGFYSVEGRNEKIDWRWDTDSEGTLVSLLSLGSRSNIDSRVWTSAWERTQKNDFPLFVYYYPLCFLDLKNRTDSAGLNLWSRASEAIQYQAGLEKHWGYSACMFPDGGYSDNQPEKRGEQKVIAPTATLACLPIEKGLVEQQVANWKFEECKFGLPGSVMLAPCGTPTWRSDYYLSIDHFSTLCMLDVARKGVVHKAANHSEILNQSLTRAGFQATYVN